MPTTQAPAPVKLPTGREELLLLALWSRRLYGLEIARAIKVASNGAINLPVGTLYPTLRQLLDQGLAEASMDDGEDARPPFRKYYELTPKGEALVELVLDFRSRLLSGD